MVGPLGHVLSSPLVCHHIRRTAPDPSDESIDDTFVPQAKASARADPANPLPRSDGQRDLVPGIFYVIEAPASLDELAAKVH